MKNLLLILAFCLPISLCFAKGETVTFIYEDIELYPDYLGNGTDIDWKKPGGAVELLKMLEQELGITVIFKRAPWKRCLEIELKEGHVDGAFLGSYKKERELLGVYPMKNGVEDVDRRVKTSTYSFYKKKGGPFSWDGKAANGLNGKKVGITLGYSIKGELIKMGLDVEEIKEVKSLYRELANGGIAAVADLETKAQGFLKENPTIAKDIEEIKPPIVSKPYYLLLSHQFVAKNPELAQKIWDAIKKLREKHLEKIEKKYY